MTLQTIGAIRVASKRNHREEYKRRLARAAARGLSRSQARGHARASEAPIRPKPVKIDDQLENALKLLRKTGNQGRAAKEAGVSTERFRNFLRSNSLAERKGRQWTITDNRTRGMTVITDGNYVEMTLRDFEQSSLNGRHFAAVGAFLRSNDIDLLRPFEGESVIDVTGQAHLLETDPNALYRIDHAESAVFHEIYRLNL